MDNFTFEQSLFIRTSAVNIQNCSREQLELIFIDLLKLQIAQQNVFTAMMKDSFLKY